MSMPPEPENARRTADPSINYEVSPKQLKGEAVTEKAGWTEEREHLHRQMLSAVSHDLKTPLASIIGSLEIYERMKTQLKPEKKDMLLHTALVEAYRLDTFLTNILDMAKLENDLVSAKREEADIGFVLQNVLDGLKIRMGDATATVNGAPRTIVHIDIALLSRAIGLLLDNAVKHSGIPTPKIELNYRRDGNVLLIDVCDNGAGIPADKIDDVFSKYTRLSRGDRQIAGTGLGLPIARQIATRLGGNLDFKSAPGGGACFTFSCAI